MHHHLFDTVFGTCAIAWSTAGLTRVMLSGSSAAKLAATMRRGGSEQQFVPLLDAAAETAAALTSYLVGQDADFDDLALDERGVPPFRAALGSSASSIIFPDLQSDIPVLQSLSDSQLLTPQWTCNVADPANRCMKVWPGKCRLSRSLDILGKQGSSPVLSVGAGMLREQGL